MSTVTVDERTPLENYSRCSPPSHKVLDSIFQTISDNNKNHDDVKKD
jgi:hypothetical protein